MRRTTVRLTGCMTSPSELMCSLRCCAQSYHKTDCLSTHFSHQSATIFFIQQKIMIDILGILG